MNLLKFLGLLFSNWDCITLFLLGNYILWKYKAILIALKKVASRSVYINAICVQVSVLSRHPHSFVNLFFIHYLYIKYLINKIGQSGSVIVSSFGSRSSLSLIRKLRKKTSLFIYVCMTRIVSTSKKILFEFRLRLIQGYLNVKVEYFVFIYAEENRILIDTIHDYKYR